MRGCTAETERGALSHLERLKEIKGRQVRGRLEGRKEDKSLLYHRGRECYTLWAAHSASFILTATPGGGRMRKRRLGQVMRPTLCHSANGYQSQGVNPDQAFPAPKSKYFTPHPGVEKMLGPFTQLPRKLISYNKTQLHYLNQSTKGEEITLTLNCNILQTIFTFCQVSTKAPSCSRIQSRTSHCI